MDVATNKMHEINFEANVYSSILETYVIPENNILFVKVSKRGLTESYARDGQALWAVNVLTKQTFCVGEGYNISKHKDHFLIKKGFKCLNPNADEKHRKWKARDHYFYLDGRPMFVKDEYLYRP